MNFFDYTQAFCKKTPIPKELPGYNQFMSNRHLASDQVLIFLANEANKFEMTDREHCDMMYHAIPRTNRFVKYLLKSKKNEELIEMIMKHYGINAEDAADYAEQLTAQDKKQLKEIYKEKISRSKKK